MDVEDVPVDDRSLQKNAVSMFIHQPLLPPILVNILNRIILFDSEVFFFCKNKNVSFQMLCFRV